MSEVNDIVTDTEAQSAFESRVQEIGKGRCKKCGMFKINQAGQWICPNCSTKENRIAPHINELPDPGHDKMEQILKSDGVVKMKVETVTNIVDPVITKKEAYGLPYITIQFNLQELEVLAYNQIMSLVYDRIVNALDDMPMPTTIKEAKQIIKIQERFIKTETLKEESNNG